MAAPTILQEERSYRRGLVLGFTLAEVVVLVIFLLLLALATLLARKGTSGGRMRATRLRRCSPRSSSHVRLIDELPDQLWARLLDGKSLGFKSLPEPPEEPLDECTDAFALVLEQARATDEAYLAATAELGDDAESLEELAAAERALKDRVREELSLPPRERAQPTHADMARAVGLDPGYDLPRPNGVISSHHHDAYLQTLLFPEEMERKLRGLLSSYRTFLQELGINTLYLALGFLEWFESDSSSKPMHAPLLRSCSCRLNCTVRWSLATIATR